MIRLIRFRRIGGRAAETPRGAARRAIVAALAASFAVLAMGGGRSALAQQPTQCAPTMIENPAGDILFGASGEQDIFVGACAQGDIGLAQGPIPTLLLAPLSPDNFSKVITLRPCSLIGGSDLPGAKLTVTFQSGNPAANARRVFTLAPDKDKPTLKTTSTPRKGTKVKPGDTIKVRMEASEEYNDTRYNWQTGVKKIQLIDEGPNPVVTPHFEATGGPRPCAEKQWKQTLEVTYIVPENPPPIIRLRAIAEDFAGNKDDDIAEFPTGDWYGTFKWKHICVGGGNLDETHGIADLALDYDGQGNLTGTLTGSTPQRAQTVPSCTFKFVAPGTFSAKLVGSYTPGQNSFSVQATNVQTRPGRASWTCPSGGGDVIDQAFFAVYEGPMFRDAFRELRRQPDGSWKLIPDGESTHSAGGGTCTTTYSLTLRQAQN